MTPDQFEPRRGARSPPQRVSSPVRDGWLLGVASSRAGDAPEGQSAARDPNQLQHGVSVTGGWWLVRISRFARDVNFSAFSPPRGEKVAEGRMRGLGLKNVDLTGAAS